MTGDIEPVALPAIGMGNIEAPIFRQCRSNVGDGEEIIIGRSVQIRSDHLGETRTLLVHLPVGYTRSQARYPVLYMLDGGAQFQHVTGLLEYLAHAGRIPPHIIVGVSRSQSNQGRSALHRASPNFESDADAILRFVTDEAASYIERHYRTQPFRIIFGHLYGGAIVAHGLLTRPEAFDAHVMACPSLWRCDPSQIARSDAAFAAMPPLPRFAMLTAAATEAVPPTYKKLLAGMANDAPDTLAWRFRLLENDDHLTAAHRTIHRAVEAIYCDWPMSWRDVLDGGRKTILDHFGRLSDRMGFRVDPTDDWLCMQGCWLLEMSRAEAAAEVLEYARALYPETVSVHLMLAEALIALEDVEGAAAACRDALDLSPDHPAAMAMLDQIGVD
jgi:predicted alpha/beta superfamily hydrolase